MREVNGIIWKTVRLYAYSRNQDISNWELILPIGLHLITSLLCTATYVTPHARCLGFEREFGIVGSKILPTCLTNPGPVLMRNFTPKNKNDALVTKVQLLESNSYYAVIKDGNGVGKTVSFTIWQLRVWCCCMCWVFPTGCCLKLPEK